MFGGQNLQKDAMFGNENLRRNYLRCGGKEWRLSGFDLVPRLSKSWEIFNFRVRAKYNFWSAWANLSLVFRGFGYKFSSNNSVFDKVNILFHRYFKFSDNIKKISITHKKFSDLNFRSYFKLSKELLSLKSSDRL